jgi:hypothetical protein
VGRSARRVGYLQASAELRLASRVQNEDEIERIEQHPGALRTCSAVSEKND